MRIFDYCRSTKYRLNPVNIPFALTIYGSLEQSGSAAMNDRPGDGQNRGVTEPQRETGGVSRLRNCPNFCIKVTAAPYESVAAVYGGK